eukprot:7299499-Alexandrium_andersonii.AAC.1
MRRRLGGSPRSSPPPLPAADARALLAASVESPALPLARGLASKSLPGMPCILPRKKESWAELRKD